MRYKYSVSVVGIAAIAAVLCIGCGDLGVNGGNGNGGGGGPSNTYTLTAYASPAGGGTISLNPNKSYYDPGEAVSVTATPNPGYSFNGWSGASTSTSTQIMVTMNGDRTLTANFSQTSNAVIITLTSWSSSEDDGLLGGGLDPRIHFVISSYQNGSRIGAETTRYLLDAQDVPNKRWSGYEESAAIKFYTQADEIRIQAVVVEKDALFDDDISPGQLNSFKPIPAAGRSGSSTLSGGKSTVGYSYRFIWQ